MPEEKAPTKKDIDVIERGDRKLSVSSNRGKASHRVRYVEVGGAAVDVDECTFCESVPDLSDTASTANK